MNGCIVEMGSPVLKKGVAASKDNFSMGDLLKSVFTPEKMINLIRQFRAYRILCKSYFETFLAFSLWL